MDRFSRQGCGVSLVAGLATLSLGCVHGAGPYPNPSRVAQGAIVGSMTGAAIGAGLDHRNRGRGALVGAVGGLLAGALLGGELEEQEDRWRDGYAHAPQDGEVWCDEHHTWEELAEPEEPEEAPGSRERVDLAPPEVLFDPGSAELSRGAKSRLRRIVDRVRRDADVELLLRGHSDGSGEEGFALSEQRARSVRAYLAEEGVAPRRIAWVGFGDTQPVASTRTAEGRQRNRRVEIVLRERDAGPYS
jgi:outer membrane protein OmpA-like peptidoglycan-associated protein